MIFKRFSLHIISRTILLVCTTLAFAYFFNLTGYHASTALLAVLILVQFIELIRFVSTTNQELTRFLDAARYADFSQRFELQELGAGFGELGRAFDEILTRLQQERTKQEQELKHLKAVVEHLPVPLISVKEDHSLTLWNGSARRLFGSHHVTQLNDLRQFGIEQPQQLTQLAAGERRLIDIDIDGMEYKLSLMATKFRVARQQEVLISMQDIQSELDVAQLQAWQDLVKVLTHEIMNSITPVASLAKTTVDLVADAQTRVNSKQDIQEDLQDISGAVNTVARRSDGLIHFVNNYRQFTRLPAPNKINIAVNELLERAINLVGQEWPALHIQLNCQVEPSQLNINVDSALIEQVLINLLKNAEHAVSNQAVKTISAKAFLNRRGRVVIEISDSGVGISDDILNNIFVPFFTTKKEGSGVGLALTRQIMSAHSGLVSVRNNVPQGSIFSLVF